MKKSLSYLWPFTKTFDSQYSGKLEVTWINGRKVLDSAHANYSYGPLQKVMDLGLAEVRAERGANVLLLGLGGGSVIPLLRKKYGYYGRITAVELDAAIIDIAKNEFSIEDHQPLELICADAENFAEQDSRQYGLILIDLFIDLQVPQQFFSRSFWQNISRLLAQDGKVLFNAGINAAHENELDQLLERGEIELNFRKKENVNGSNSLVFAEKV